MIDDCNVQPLEKDPSLGFSCGVEWSYNQAPALYLFQPTGLGQVGFLVATEYGGTAEVENVIRHQDDAGRVSYTYNLNTIAWLETGFGVEGVINSLTVSEPVRRTFPMSTAWIADDGGIATPPSPLPKPSRPSSPVLAVILLLMWAACIRYAVRRIRSGRRLPLAWTIIVFMAAPPLLATAVAVFRHHAIAP